MTNQTSQSWHDIARATLEGAEAETLNFPDVVRMLLSAGFDGYVVDFRRATRTYYRPDGGALELPTEPTEPVSALFDVAAVRQAIREAQGAAPGYTYRGFCAKVVRAGCAGYLVSLIGRRVLYVGRTGETHTELFHSAPPP